MDISHQSSDKKEEEMICFAGREEEQQLSAPSAQICEERAVTDLKVEIQNNQVDIVDENQVSWDYHEENFDEEEPSNMFIKLESSGEESVVSERPFQSRIKEEDTGKLQSEIDNIPSEMQRTCLKKLEFDEDGDESYGYETPKQKFKKRRVLKLEYIIEDDEESLTNFSKKQRKKEELRSAKVKKQQYRSPTLDQMALKKQFKVLERSLRRLEKVLYQSNERKNA